MNNLRYIDNLNDYYVYYDKEELTDLKKYAIEDACTIIHLDYEGPYYKSPYYRKNSENFEILNFKKELVRIEKDNYGRNKKIYHYSYDKKFYPYIASLIDKLLNDDLSCLNEVYYPNLVKEIIPIYYSIDSLEHSLINTDCTNYNKKLEILYELEYLVKKARDHKEEVKVLFYYEALQEAITLKENKELTLRK